MVNDSNKMSVLRDSILQNSQFYFSAALLVNVCNIYVSRSVFPEYQQFLLILHHKRKCKLY